MKSSVTSSSQCVQSTVFQDILVVNRTISHVELSELQQYLPWLAAQSHIL